MTCSLQGFLDLTHSVCVTYSCSMDLWQRLVHFFWCTLSWLHADGRALQHLAFDYSCLLILVLEIFHVETTFYFYESANHLNVSLFYVLTPRETGL
jgi:hypothetical protein